jgi:hypothetical protein
MENENSGKREERVKSVWPDGSATWLSVLNGIFGIRCSTPTLSALQTESLFTRERMVREKRLCCETSAVGENFEEANKCWAR